MKLIVQKDVESVRQIVTNYYDDYNIINNSQVDQDTYFLVVEKYFFRTGNRASLSIVLSRIDELSCKVESVGSGTTVSFPFPCVAPTIEPNVHTSPPKVVAPVSP